MSEFKMLQIGDSDGVKIARVQVRDIAETEIEGLTRELGVLVDTEGARNVLVDLKIVRFLTSSAIGMLIATQKKLKGLGGQMKLCGLHPEIKQLFQITQVDRLFEIHGDEDDAVGSFS